jgi:signal transduction histidine kinase
VARRRAARPSGASTGPLVAVLLLTLGVAVALTWIAWAAAVSHRAAVEDALRDHAEFAAAQYAAEASARFVEAARVILAPVGAQRRTDVEADRVYDPVILERAARDLRACQCVYDPAPRYFFAYSLADGSLRTAGASLPASERSWLRDSLASNLDTLAARRERTVNRRPALHAIVEAAAGRTDLAMLVLVPGAPGVPTMAYGFVTTFERFAQVVLPELINGPLVPRSLSRGLPNDSLLGVTVRDPRGRVMYRSTVQYDTTYAAAQPLWHFLPTGPQVQIAVRPEAADRLVRGGIPRSPSPVLVALLLGVGALVLIALHLARRSHELARLRDDFTSSVSHELRTPLTQILLFAESLQFGRLSGEPERAHALGIVLREARRLVHLVNNVLLFSRTERRATHVSAHPRRLAPLVRDVVQSFEPLARARRATVRTALDERVVAAVDPDAIRQIVLNLLDNAVKYGPEGQTVDVGLGLAGTRARLWVDDEGSGIHESDWDRVWEPFVRLASGEYSVATGSGIGLSVVRRLVALHGGECRVARSPAGGARFEIELPGWTAESSAPDAAPSPVSIG